MKKRLLIGALILSIMMPVMPVHAGLFDGFLGWLQNTFSSFIAQR